MIAKRLFLNHSPSEWFSFIQKSGAVISASLHENRFFAYKVTPKKAHLLRPSSLSCDVSLRLLTVSQSRCENDSEKFEQ